MKKGKRRMFVLGQKLIGALFITISIVVAKISLGGLLMSPLFIILGIYAIFTKQLLIPDFIKMLDGENEE